MITPQLGALKDPIDERDYPIKAFLRPKVAAVPTSVDVSGTMPPVRDQGTEGSCVSFATTAAKEYDEGMFATYLSPRFIADRIQLDADSGAYPRDAMDVLLHEGVCPEECQPYIARVHSLGCLKASELASSNRIRAYARLNTLDEMKQYLNERGAFVASFRVTQNWFSPVQGLVVPQGAIIGGHAVCVVGYDDTKQVIKFRNSWGNGWGANGYGYLPYISVGQYLMDAWSMVDIPEEAEYPPSPRPVPPQPEPEPTPIPPEPEPIPVPPIKKNWIQVLIEFLLNLFKRK